MYRGILVVFVTVLSQFVFELNFHRALGNGQPYGHLCEEYLASIDNIMRSNNGSDYMYQTYSLFCPHQKVFSRLNELVHNSQFFADTARCNFYQPMLEYGLKSGDYQGVDLEVISEFYGYFNKADENLSRENINHQYQNLIKISSEDIKSESIYGFLPFAKGSKKKRRPMLKHYTRLISQRDFKLMKNIKPGDFFEKSPAANSITLISNATDKTIDWMILQVKKTKKNKRKKALKDLLYMGEKFLKERNFQGVHYVHSALEHFEKDLKNSRIRHRPSYIRLTKVMSPLKNWSGYHQEVKIDKPFIPFLPITLSNFSRLKETLSVNEQSKEMSDIDKILNISNLMGAFYSGFNQGFKGFSV